MTNISALKKTLFIIDFDVKYVEGKYWLVDLQGANLGGVCDNPFESAHEIFNRLLHYFEDLNENPFISYGQFLNGGQS